MPSPEYYYEKKFEKLVHVVGFIVRIGHKTCDTP
jgi:hypothetical protein